MTTTKKPIKKTKTQSTISNQSLVYYLLRVIQRFAILSLGLITVAYWAMMISITVSSVYKSVGSNEQFTAQLNSVITQSDANLTRDVKLVVFVAAAISLLLFLVPRVVKYDKKLIVDSFVFIIFCLLAVIWCSPLISSFIAAIG